VSPIGLPGLKPGHDQSGFRVRLEWGPTGARAVTADLAVVVDVLSFTTTLSVAVERGITVFPYRWRDDSVAAYARERDAAVAVGRLEAREQAGQVSLSPAAMAQVEGLERLVLPSPNGSTIAHLLADSGATVVAASLRNASAVARWLLPHLGSGASLVVVPAGERWPDDSLRPCAEDLWGAGAVLHALLEAGVEWGVDDLSPEARLAVATFGAAVDGDLVRDLHACAGGRELAAAGFADDVDIAAQLDVSTVVPVLRGDAFVAG